MVKKFEKWINIEKNYGNMAQNEKMARSSVRTSVEAYFIDIKGYMISDVEYRSMRRLKSLLPVRASSIAMVSLLSTVMGSLTWTG